jgi:SRSO17 transposase
MTQSGGVRFDAYMDHLAECLGHADRVAGLKGYCTGLMLPLERKSVEPMAAGIDPQHVSARHQALHHFVAKADWSEQAMLRAVAEWVLPKMNLKQAVWIIDDTGMPKQGQHSVGVARQYCGQLGKQDNCQVAVSVSLATDQGSLPMAYRLYLPKEWAEDRARRRKAGVPEDIEFATKTQLALQQLEGLLAQGHPKGCVLADAAYGVDSTFRQRLSALGLSYMVGVTSAVVVWPPGVLPLPPKRYTGQGRPPLVPRRTARLQPMDVRALAMSLPNKVYRQITWREGSNAPLRGRFAAVRVRHAGGNSGRARLRDEQWLLIEWPAGDAEPMKYYLSNLPRNTSLKHLVSMAHQRWRIERDYQDLKQELGLGHYEGRGWRGFHHHAALSIAAYGFLMSERLRGGLSAKKNTARRPQSTLPEGYIPRGSPARPATRRRLASHSSPRTERRTAGTNASLPVLRKTLRRMGLMTQYD